MKRKTTIAVVSGVATSTLFIGWQLASPASADETTSGRPCWDGSHSPGARPTGQRRPRPSGTFSREPGHGGKGSGQGDGSAPGTKEQQGYPAPSFSIGIRDPQGGSGGKGGSGGDGSGGGDGWWDNGGGGSGGGSGGDGWWGNGGGKGGDCGSGGGGDSVRCGWIGDGSGGSGGDDDGSGGGWGGGGSGGDWGGWGGGSGGGSGGGKGGGGSDDGSGGGWGGWGGGSGVGWGPSGGPGGGSGGSGSGWGGPGDQGGGGWWDWFTHRRHRGGHCTSPTASPTDIPTSGPTGTPTDGPTGQPTSAPTNAPTSRPTQTATAACTNHDGNAANVVSPGVGAVTVTIKVCNGKISTVSSKISQSNWDANASAMKKLDTLAVQYYKTDPSKLHVSGATLTSNAYKTSLAAAVSKAGI